jgi:hypothetical protein
MQVNQDKDTIKTKKQVWIKHTVQETNKIPVTERFSAPVQTAPGGPSSLLYNGYRVSFYGGGTGGERIKRAGRGVNHPPTSNAEVKERADLYLYRPSGTSWPVVR